LHRFDHQSIQSFLPLLAGICFVFGIELNRAKTMFGAKALEQLQPFIHHITDEWLCN